jgi:CHAT domain-containing protein
MMDSDARSGPWTRLALILCLGLLSAACQTGFSPRPMSLDEARKVVATFSAAPDVPSPRTINDITAILDRPRSEPEPDVLRAADELPPDTSNRATLAEFYYRRGHAARQLGRGRQEIADLTMAAQNAAAGIQTIPRFVILNELGQAERNAGNFSRSLEYRLKAIEGVPLSQPGWLLGINVQLVGVYAILDDVKEAKRRLAETTRFFYETIRSTTPRPRYVAQLAVAEAILLEHTGKYVEAERSYRRAAAEFAQDDIEWNRPSLDIAHWLVARTLIRQGRLLEAEHEARKAVLGALAKQGRHSPHTAWMLNALIWTLREQGRYEESERLARAGIDIYEQTGASADSLWFAQMREHLALALELQGRDREALAQYETIRTGLADDPASLRTFLDGHAGYATVLLRTGHVDRALEVFGAALERTSPNWLASEAPRDLTMIRASLARAHAARGDVERALREFREVVPLLLTRSQNVNEAVRSRPADRRFVDTLNAYIGLLADIKETALERETGMDAAAEAFRLADVVRGRSVQSALNASAVRAAATSPALAELIRQGQDARGRLDGLNLALANALSQPGDSPNATAVMELRDRIATLQGAIQALDTQIAKEFPAYADLIDPKPVTLEQARAMLRPGEALIAMLSTSERTFVWAIPRNGRVAFAAAPVSVGEIGRTVTTLRAALEPRAKTLGDVPEFNVALAHRLYRTLLEPVRSGWEDARSLIVVGHGPLVQLPLALLPTQPVTVEHDSSLLFSGYREVPWLIRTHAVTVLPSVASLATLRALPAGDPGRRPFVGFGDPYFSREQALAAAESQASTTAAAGEPRSRQTAALVTRAVPITLRSSPQAFDSAQLASLPRLPDTGDEIRSLAATMNADLQRDVFLGARANERVVKTSDLGAYRVVAFATHGLVPGDLDGLTQPALALSAPAVAGVEGDGLLTMDEILGLRLNADWIVLSACNTASGQGAGSEAVSGLGRAFFYAGARALLVSNWPVETTSARALTTGLFRRQQTSPGITRAQALQQTLNGLIDRGEFVDADSGKAVFSYAHPIFWAPFTLIGDGGGDASAR